MFDILLTSLIVIQHLLTIQSNKVVVERQIAVYYSIKSLECFSNDHLKYLGFKQV